MEAKCDGVTVKLTVEEVEGILSDIKAYVPVYGAESLNAFLGVLTSAFQGE
jgi:hypothetical protein